MKSIRFSRRTLRCAALLTLLLPSASFLITWLRPVLGLPMAAALLAAFAFYVRAGAAPARDVFGHEEDVFECPLSVFSLVCLCALLWTFLSGIGGLFYQTEDHYGRNAIFSDMLYHTWPVYFEGTSSALTYYIAYWLLPALAAKGAAALFGTGALWPAANAALFVQTLWFLVLALLLFLSLVRAKGLIKNALGLLLFVFFSGMDALMIPWFPNWWNNQLEWWAQGYQFSSNTTGLFWVYNQALPAWLAMALLLDHPEDTGSFALIGLCAFPFSPMPFIGLMVYFIGLAVVKGIALTRERGAAGGIRALLFSCLTARNLLACVSIAPAFIPYFMANAASDGAPFRFDIYAGAYGAFGAVARLALFLIIEFGAFALILLPRFRKNPAFLLTALSLILAPMFRIGYAQDFSMRASIPGLMALCLFCGRYLLAEKGVRRAAAIALTCLLLIGSVTPMMEFVRGAYKVKKAGTIFLTANPFKTVLHPEADTYNFICEDVADAVFYRYLAKPDVSGAD
ncbi:MAG: hypothetical protein IKU34_04835 [Clostridia bacterium]|nr:hypothetical protein [Clostridia bacterium]